MELNERKCSAKAVGWSTTVRGVLMAWAFSAMPAFADYAASLALVKAGKYPEAIAAFKADAVQGNSQSQSALGEIYRDGLIGVSKNAELAAQWYRKAAEQGEANAQQNLGVMYENGAGVPQDAAQAAAWYRKAAEQGLASAQNDLGGMYANGIGVPKDAVQAVTWYRKAAEQGNADAQRDLGLMYASGTGVPKNATQAVAWYRKAADQGHAKAQLNLGLMYASGTGVPKNATQAVAWYRKAAEQGHAGAQHILGAMYANGDGVGENLVIAYALQNLAATKSNEGIAKLMALDLKRKEEAMSPQQIQSAQALSRTMYDTGEIGASIDKYLSTVPTAATAKTAERTVSAPARTNTGDGFPAVPPKRPGVISCNTQCLNADCKRTYDDGRKERFQAKPKFDPFTNQLTWDSGIC